MKKFWMVICLNQSLGMDNTPRKKHETLESAKTEAERLCFDTRRNFGILELTEHVSYPDPKLKWGTLK